MMQAAPLLVQQAAVDAPPLSVAADPVAGVRALAASLGVFAAAGSDPAALFTAVLDALLDSGL
jgi:hypothetical protein